MIDFGIVLVKKGAKHKRLVINHQVKPIHCDLFCGNWQKPSNCNWVVIMQQLSFSLPCWIRALKSELNKPIMPSPLSIKKRWKIVGMKIGGMRVCDIARNVRVSRKAVWAVLSLYRNTNDVTPGKSPGRPRKTTARQDRQLILMARRGRTRSAASLREEWQDNIGVPISRETVNRRLVKKGYRARRPVRKQRLMPRHKGLRLRFARAHRNLTVNHWRHVLFGDESRFLLNRVDGRVRVRRLQGEALHKDCILYAKAGGGGSVHVWGAFHAGGRSELVILDRNVTGVVYLNILRENLLPWARQTFADNFRYQDDNVPAHRARIVRDFMEQEGVAVLHQPPLSSDCNPIEHLWDELQRAVDSRDAKPKNLQELGHSLGYLCNIRAEPTTNCNSNETYVILFLVYSCITYQKSRGISGVEHVFL